jgi:hypothetical protein
MILVDRARDAGDVGNVGDLEHDVSKHELAHAQQIRFPLQGIVITRQVVCGIVRRPEALVGDHRRRTDVPIIHRRETFFSGRVRRMGYLMIVCVNHWRVIDSKLPLDGARL